MKEEEEERKKERKKKPQNENIMSASATQGGHNNDDYTFSLADVILLMQFITRTVLRKSQIGSAEMSPLNRAHTTSCSPSKETMLSCSFIERQTFCNLHLRVFGAIVEDDFIRMTASSTSCV